MIMGKAPVIHQVVFKGLFISRHIGEKRQIGIIVDYHHSAGMRTEELSSSLVSNYYHVTMTRCHLQKAANSEGCPSPQPGRHSASLPRVTFKILHAVKDYRNFFVGSEPHSPGDELR
jgi:hypothetical protein